MKMMFWTIVMSLILAPVSTAGTTTTLWADQSLDVINFTPAAGVPLDLLVSSNISNASGFDSMRVSVKFTDLMPAGPLLTGQIGIEVDYKDANNVWQLFPAYQGNWLKRSDQAPIRVIIAQPSINQFEPGTTDIVFTGPIKACEVTRHQLTVPNATLRVRIVLVEGDPGGTNAWDSVTLSGEVELYNAP